MDMHSNRVVVIGVDNTDSSDKAFTWLLEQLYRPTDDIHLVHVVPSVRISSMYGSVYFNLDVTDPEGYDKSIRITEAKICERFASKLPPNARLTVHIIRSPASSIDAIGGAIVKKARDLDANLVMVAFHKRKLVTELIKGSVARYVVQRA